jgi:GT2 family glycosyltransferase
VPIGVDVVIPTFKRPEALARCLEALEKQTVAPASIEVVDDSAEDRGPAYSRNIGWRRGSAPLVAFTDDDCVPSENWIASIQRRFEDAGVHGIEGSVTTVDERGNLGDMNPNPRDRWNRFKTANMAYRREVLEEVGGFDERYYIHREDTDLAWRVINSGHRIDWSSECVVHHPDRGGVPRVAFDSEQLLYRCDPSKYLEVAAASISFSSIKDGTLGRARRGMRTEQEGGVAPLTRTESLYLWTRALAKATIRKISGG